MKGFKKVALIIIGIFSVIVAIASLLLSVGSIVASFVGIPMEIIHDDANYYKGKVIEVSHEGDENNLNLYEVYFKIIDENGVTHNTLVMVEQNLNVLERNHFIFEYEGKEIECVFSNYGEGFEEEKFVVAVYTQDKEYLSYNVGKTYLEMELGDNSTLYVMSFVFGFVFIGALMIAIMAFKRGKKIEREKNEKEHCKRKKGNRWISFIGGYMFIWGVCAGILVTIFTIIGMFQVDVDNIAKEEICYQTIISKIEISDRNGINYYEIFIENEEIRFGTEENEKIAIENGLIKDYLNGNEIVCIYTYVDDVEDANIIALYSEDKVYLDRGTGVDNLKAYYVQINKKAKALILIFGILSSIFIVVGAIMIIINKKIKKNENKGDKSQKEKYKTRIGPYVCGGILIFASLICFFLTLIWALLGTMSGDVAVLKDDSKYVDYEVTKVEENVYDNQKHYSIYVYNEEYQYEEEVAFYSDTNEQLAYDNGFFNDWSDNKMRCIYNPYIFGDGDKGKIASLYTNEEVYLDYETGKANLVASFEESLKKTNIIMGVAGGLGVAFMVSGIVIMVVATKLAKKRYEKYMFEVVTYLNE